MTVSAYDAIASWYEQWAIWPAACFQWARHLLPDEVTGQRVLDVACGHGRLSRELAEAGADVVGVDVSTELINRARSLSDSTGAGITYRNADVAAVEDWWDGVPFDGAACEMALMDIADLEGTLRAVATVLRPNGWFVATWVNPCFPGNRSGLSSWPPDDGYCAEGFWTSPDHNPDGVRIRIGSYHRTLSTYMNSMLDSGLRIERVAEPTDDLPQFLAVACRR